MEYPRDMATYLPPAGRIAEPVARFPQVSREDFRVRIAGAEYAAARAALVRRADEALEAGPFSVVDSGPAPVSGDVHDYYSMGPYWWPNPDTPDGLPYIRRDGEVNPESERTDRTPLHAMGDAVAALCLAYVVTSATAYADRAALLLRTWFLDDATRMNPHLEYGQAIPGVCTGRGVGIIDTTALAKTVVPTLTCLGEVWPHDERIGVQKWFRDYLEWLTTSDHGADEARAANNHSVSFDLQLTSFGLFIGAEELVRAVLDEVGSRRVDVQIEPDGSQPQELRRTRSLSYSTMNTSLFLDLVEAGRCVGVDLGRYVGPDGRSIRAAVEWMRPYATGASPWTHQQITEPPYDRIYGMMKQAAWLFNDEAYARDAENVVGLSTEEKKRSEANLLYPAGA